MVQTASTMLPLGTKAPSFQLTDVLSGKKVGLLPSQGTVIIFMCNHCPYVIHIIHTLLKVANDYGIQGFRFLAINSNDTHKYPDDSPEKMKEWGQKLNFPFPYLFDETQEVAKAYQAACTPDFYVFDREMKCVYRGQFDDSRPGQSQPVTGKDLTAALDQMIKGQPVSADQRPSVGCNIKWK